MKNQVFVPTAAESKKDIATSWEVQESLAQADYRRGLMLVMCGGIEAVTDKSVCQCENLRHLKTDYGDAPVVVMLSSLPTALDWFSRPTLSFNHVIAGINFAGRLPIGSRKIVTFRLNSPVSNQEFRSRTDQAWRSLFLQNLAPALKDAARYAKSCGVELKVETVPVPEFGDMSPNKKVYYAGRRLRDLRNPFYLTRLWGFDELRELGIGICLDLCHSRTIYKMAANEAKGVLFPDDVVPLASTGLMHDVMGLTSDDLVHLNDGRGYFTEDGGVFEKGVALGEGDISEMRAIIARLEKMQIPFVLKINETDFENRPNTKRSIGYLLELQ